MEEKIKVYHGGIVKSKREVMKHDLMMSDVNYFFNRINENTGKVMHRLIKRDE